MAYLESNGQRILLDEEGFLVDMEQWDEKIAKLLAAREEQELSEDAMEILRFMRKYYMKFHAFPILHYVCKNVHQARECVREKFLDPMVAWKLAGLPKPDVVDTESTDERHKIYNWVVPD
ncbi:MAG: TusE/DsrC/DsvC family sulfur relay protein [Deltaproteobacteria bacterium]|jgi:TusE/DsrC/DsvC family sulfur relay protein